MTHCKFVASHLFWCLPKFVYIIYAWICSFASRFGWLMIALMELWCMNETRSAHNSSFPPLKKPTIDWQCIQTLCDECECVEHILVGKCLGMTNARFTWVHMIFAVACKFDGRKSPSVCHTIYKLVNIPFLCLQFDEQSEREKKKHTFWRKEKYFRDKKRKKKKTNEIERSEGTRLKYTKYAVHSSIFFVFFCPFPYHSKSNA